jgi:hypothetical protein
LAIWGVGGECGLGYDSGENSKSSTAKRDATKEGGVGSHVHESPFSVED